MGYYIPSFFQKRILRYALSKLGLLDTDALDLEKLDIAWGKRSYFELRDVGLQLDKIAALLHLPSYLTITRATILLLKVTIPSDIYSSGIVFEVEGIRVEASVSAEHLDRQDRDGKKRQKDGPSKGVGTNLPRRTRPKQYDPAIDEELETSGGELEDDEETTLPTTEELANSFLEAEPAGEKEELKAAIAKSHALGQSQLSESEDLEPDEGFGTALSLPGFVADFLKGIKARTQAIIRGVQLDLKFNLDVSSLSSQPGGSTSLETISLQLTVEEIKLAELVTTANNRKEASPTLAQDASFVSDSVGNRRITVKGIQGNLFSEASLFNFLSQLSGPSSPTNTHTGTFPKGSKSGHLSIAGSASPTSVTATSSFKAPRYEDADVNSKDHAKTISNNGMSMASDVVRDENDDDDGLGDLLHSLDESQMYAIEEAQRSLNTQSERLRSSSDADSDLGTAQESFFSQDDAQTTIDEDPNYHSLRNSPDLVRSEASHNPLNYMSAFGSATSIDHLDHGVVAQSTPRTADMTSERTFATEVEDTEEDASSQYHDSSPVPNDMVESRIYSHEEAQSMYHSAVAETPFVATYASELDRAEDSQDHEIPPGSAGAPGHLVKQESNSPKLLEEEVSGQPEMAQNAQLNPPVTGSVSAAMEVHEGGSAGKGDLESSEARPQGVHSATSQPTSPKRSQPGSQESPNLVHLMVKTFLTVDAIVLEFPEETASHSSTQEEGSPVSTDGPSRMHQIPGGFSQSIIMSSHVVETPRTGKTQPSKPPPDRRSKSPVQGHPFSVSVEKVMISSDMSLTRLAVIAALQLPPASKRHSVEKGNKKDTMPFNFKLRVRRMTWRFLALLKGKLRGDSQSPGRMTPDNTLDSEVLLVTDVRDLSFAQTEDATISKRDASIGKFVFGYEDEPIVSFDSSLRMRESVRDVLAPVGQDIKISISGTEKTFSDITIMTLPLHIKLDLTRLDETFSWFGGLSGMLELGNSMMSTVTITDPKSKSTGTPEKSRGVRFEAPKGLATSPVDEKPSSQLKVTARIGGMALDIRGRKASINIEGTAVKVVSRGGGVRVRIDRIKFAGPILETDTAEPAVTIISEAVRFEYLPLPTDDDLDRLLALLSPSNDRDEPENDILLETFLRQRRQGGVLRVDVEMIKGSIVRLQELNQLAAMSEELKKLSTVAKYLPEDDRPGILTLAQVDKTSLEVEVNGKLGFMQLQSYGAQVAQVTFPSLLLLGVDSLHVQNNGRELVGEVHSQSSATLATGNDPSDRSPMIMARFIGDDMEPTLKIKLWNLRMEYHISTLMAILGITETASGEIIMADMVSSVATLTAAQRSLPRSSTQSSASSGKSSSTKLLKFDIALRDTIIGLNPRGSPARGLVVFTKAKLKGTFPRMDDLDLDGSLEISKLSFLIIDDVANIESLKDRMSRSVIAISERVKTQVETLAAMGYVSVSEISSAKIKLQMSAPEKGAERSLEVDISDDLFVLETCADSTQTLQAILNGLKPSMPPSTELKYRTEVIPVQDMLASFTGDAFATEVAEGDDTDYAAAISESEFMNQEAQQSLGLESSFYEPNDHGDAKGVEDSILEDALKDPGSPAPSQHKSTKPLLSSFREQTEMVDDSGPLSFNEEHFGAGPDTGGPKHKWNSDRNKYDLVNEVKASGSPFRLRLREVHIIWNLFDGYDWQRTREAISQAVAEVETKAAEKQARRGKRMSLEVEDDEESVIGDFLFNSIYIGVGSNQNPRDLARQVNRNIDDMISESGSYTTTTRTSASESPSRQGIPKTKRSRLRLRRSRHHKMTFELKGVSVDFTVFAPDSGETQSSVDIRVRDLEIFDHVPTSTWKKFATYMHDAGERESGTNMVHIEILNVRPVPDLAASEIVLRATVLPLRLHVDQDALDFMTRFFEFRDDSAPAAPSPSEVPFIQRAEINSVPVKLDFKPKRVDYAGLRSGRTTEFMNFIVLESSDMVLRHVIIYGVSGFDKLGKTLNDIWMPDIKRNQLPGVLAGLAPVRSLVNVGSGVRDLVVIPMREYRKDGRVMRAVQKGALAFAKTTTTELARLGAKLAVGTQTVLQNAEGALVSRPTSSPAATSSDLDSDADEGPEERAAISPYADPPIGVLQGLRGAYRHLERDLLLAKDAIVAMPGEVMESGSPAGAARAVLRGAPTVVLRPALGVTKAVGQTLMGATSALDKEERRRIEDKYKRR